jgi:gluconolactonase
MNRTVLLSLSLSTLTFTLAARDASSSAEPVQPNSSSFFSLFHRAEKPKHVYPKIGGVERLDPALDQLIAPGAQIELLATGFTWAEGPVWSKKGDYLLFSDVPNNGIYKWEEGVGTREFLFPSGYTGTRPRGGEPGSNGLTFDDRGRLVLCQHGDRQIGRLDGPVKITPLVQFYQHRRFNSPNDLVYKSNGDLYFTDPSYGLVKHEDDPARELNFNGVYRLKPNGEITLLTRDLTFPNGIAFSPDESTLYVSVSDPNHAIWMAYDVENDGTISNGRVFADVTALTKDKKGLPDGMKVDIQGNLWATGPGGILVFSPTGRHLGTINTGDATGNCAFGDDGSMLYMTVHTNLCRIQTLARGLGF